MPATAPALSEGSQRPRLWSAPSFVSTEVDEVYDLAATAGLFLDDWQRWVLEQSLGYDNAGKWAAFEVGLIVSRQNGKGGILEARELAGLFMFGEELLMHTAHEFKTSREAFKRILDEIQAVPAFDAKVMNVRTSHGEEGIELRPTPIIITGPGGRQITRSRRPELRFIARSTASGRGFTGDLVVYDEAMTLDVDDVAATGPTMSARYNLTDGGPQVWYTASAGNRKSTQLGKVRRRGMAGNTLDDTGRREGDPQLAFAEWSIDPHTEHCDPECDRHDELYAEPSYAKSNPAYPHRINLATIARERRMFDDDEAFARERLGVGTYPAEEYGWEVIPEAWWQDTMTSTPGTLRSPGLAIHTTQDRAWSTLAVAGALPDGRTEIRIVRHAATTRWVLSAALAAFSEWGPVAVVIDPASAARSFIEPLELAGIVVERPQARDVGVAFSDFYDLTRDRSLLHADDDVLAKSIAGAATRSLGGQKTWDESSSAAVLSPVVACSLALWGHRKNMPADYDVAASVGWDVTEVIRLVRKGVYTGADVERLYRDDLLDDAALTKIAAAGIRVPDTLIGSKP